MKRKPTLPLALLLTLAFTMAWAIPIIGTEPAAPPEIVVNDPAHDVEAKIHTPETRTVYYLTINWGAMKFVYDKGTQTWDPLTHTYTGAGAWLAADDAVSERYLDGFNNKITITNHSNAAVDASLRYTRMGGAALNAAVHADNVLGGFYGDALSAQSAAALLTQPAASPAYNTLGPGRVEESGPILLYSAENRALDDGKITADAYFAFSGTPDSTVNIAAFAKVGVITITVAPTADEVSYAPAPGAVIDYASEKLTALENGAHTFNGLPATVTDGTYPIAESWMGGAVSIVKLGGESASPFLAAFAAPIAPTAIVVGDSAPQHVLIPARPAAPVGLTGRAETFSGDHDGRIIGFDASRMERQDGGVWVSQGANLAPGAYAVRYKATASAFAGATASVVIAAGPEKTWAIALNRAGTYTFSGDTYGYSPLPAARALAVNVSNPGNQPTGSLTVALSGSAASFTVSKTSLPSIGVSAADTFTVIPATGLNAGTHTATVRVSGANVEEKSFTVSFTVSKASLAGAAFTIPTDPTYTGSALTPAISGVTFNGATLSAATDYTVSYTNNTNARDKTAASPPTVTIEARAGSVNYTGSKSVAFTIKKANPGVTSWPSGLTATYGQTLANVSLSGKGSSSTAGTFAWVSPGNSVGDVGTRSHTVKFTPNDTANYNELSQSVSVTVGKADPVVTWPSGLTATYGQTLSNVSLSGRGSSSPAGTFAWASSGNAVGDAGTRWHSMTFTPSDTTRYNTLRKDDVQISVGKADGASLSDRVVQLESIAYGNFLIGVVAEPSSTWQKIQYGISTRSDGGDIRWNSVWNESKLGTENDGFYEYDRRFKVGNDSYYLYVRAAENDNYKAGNPIRSSSAIGKTGWNGSVSFHLNAWGNGSLDFYVRVSGSYIKVAQFDDINSTSNRNKSRSLGFNMGSFAPWMIEGARIDWRNSDIWGNRLRCSDFEITMNLPNNVQKKLGGSGTIWAGDVVIDNATQFDLRHNGTKLKNLGSPW